MEDIIISKVDNGFILKCGKHVRCCNGPKGHDPIVKELRKMLDLVLEEKEQEPNKISVKESK